MTSSTNSTSTIEDLSENGNPNSEAKKHKSRAAIFTDEERLKIIEEIYKRRSLWDTENREAINISPVNRKKAFEEIANLIADQTHNPSLNADRVEKQWKNLKDTFVKIRKKRPTNENGTPTPPRWRFYRLLQFIDSDDKIAKSFNFSKELAAIQSEQRSKFSSSSTSNTSTTANQLNNSALISNGIAKSSHFAPIPSLHPTSTVIPHPSTLNRQQVNQQPSRLKRLPETQLTYIRHAPPSTIPPLQTNHVNSLGLDDPQMPSSSHKEQRLSMTPLTNGIITNGIHHEDEYSIFCKSLIPSVRDIGMHSKMDYLQLQKIIHDAMYNAQSKIHNPKNGK